MLIEGRIEEISAGTVTNGSRTKVEYIKVDGKRHQNLLYDNYIGTALKNALDDGESVSFSLSDSLIVAIKRNNGEVSRIKQSLGLYIFASFFQLLIISGFLGLIVSGIVGLIFGSVVVFAIMYFLSLAIGAGILIKSSITYNKARDAFGEDT
ncbi:hypothetical protein [Endozoicomonas sp.]|uniref:hypothetical protein n=1 Tax=Endozoicomonas sp. TaxID=1892382 RepID=UPI00383A4025